VPDTFEFDFRHLDFEMFLVFFTESALCMILSIGAVLLVVLIITGSGYVTLMVAACVVVTDFFLAGCIYYWGLTFNQIVFLNIIVAIGTSVDYSTHIAYAYLTTKTPKECDTPRKKRAYKVKVALTTMGSSVWHGGFSTFVAIVTLAPSSSYIFVVFFRLWLGIIFFGLANGFMLLPVILSFFGPLYSVDDPQASDDAPETDAEDLDKEPELSIIETPTIYNGT